MDKLLACPMCAKELTVHSPEDWKPTFYDPDSGGDPYSAVCVCGFHFSIGSCDWEEFLNAANRRPEPENKPLELHFGNGDIGVSTCKQEGSEVWNEIVLWNPHMKQAIGDSIPITEGTTTDDIEIYARLYFHKPESAQVVVDALNRIIDDYNGNKPLALAELRERDGKPVWVSMMNAASRGEWYIVDVEEMELKNPWDRIVLEGWDEGDYFKAYDHPPQEPLHE